MNIIYYWLDSGSICNTVNHLLLGPELSINSYSNGNYWHKYWNSILLWGKTCYYSSANILSCFTRVGLCILTLMLTEKKITNIFLWDLACWVTGSLQYIATNPIKKQLPHIYLYTFLFHILLILYIILYTEFSYFTFYHLLYSFQ